MSGNPDYQSIHFRTEGETDLLCEFFSNLKSLAYEPKRYELSTRTGFEEESHLL